MKINRWINFASLILIGVLLGLTSSLACEHNPGKISISVSGAQAASYQNYYVVGIPEQGKTNVTITGSGQTPCPTDQEKCKCGNESAAPETDGDPEYTFTKAVGEQEPTDGPTVKWEVDSSTSPGEYKFKVTKIQQGYKACPQGLTGGVASKSNTQASDKVTILACKVEMQFASSKACDGETLDVDLKVQPSSASSYLANGAFTCRRQGGGAIQNPSGQPSKMLSKGFPDYTKWQIDNVRWFSTQSDHCNDSSPYEVIGTVEVRGVNVNVKSGSFTAEATAGPGQCLNGSASVTTPFSGVPSYSTVFDSSTGKYMTTVSTGSFSRTVGASQSVTAPFSSQYRGMIAAEEAYHANSQITNPNHAIMGTAFLTANVLSMVQASQPYAGNTAAESLSAAKSAFAAATNFELSRSYAYFSYPSPTRCALEKEAKSAVNASYRLIMKCTYTACP